MTTKAGSAGVRWLPWCDESFEQARRHQRLVLLFSGYPTALGCAAMDEQSHADAALAGFIHEHFVPVRIDCELQPGIDRYYQIAHQLLTREGGGWPLLALLSPDTREPFFSSGYLPPRSSGGLPAYGEVLARALQFHQAQPPALQAQSMALRDALANVDDARADPATLLGDNALQAARRALEAEFDPGEGGWASTPRFAHAGRLQAVLRHWRSSADGATPDLAALYMLTLTLTRMHEGALRDPADGGFFRCCHGPGWQAPQPEKHLADNAQLLTLYCDAYRATGDVQFRAVATGIARFLLQVLRRADGLFAAAVGNTQGLRDGRVLVGANAMAIAALANAGAALADDDCSNAAEAAWRALQRQNLMARPCGPADPALLIEAALALLAQRPGATDLALAREQATVLLESFEDRERGGFFDVTLDAGVPRLRSFADDVLPSPTGLATRALLRLGLVTGEAALLQAAERSLQAAWPALLARPAWHATLLEALRDWLEPPTRVVLQPGDPAAPGLQRSLQRHYAPQLLVCWQDG
jgi:uncharacterized protein YyaL (SSP411 family)